MANLDWIDNLKFCLIQKNDLFLTVRMFLIIELILFDNN